MLYWIPLTLLMYMTQAWISMKGSGATSWKWFWLMQAVSIIPIWAFVSRHTPKEQMVLTAFVFDIVMLIGFQLGLYLCGAMKSFNWVQWTGFTIILLGVVVLKSGEIIVK